jgi:basic membrane protein A
MTNAPRGLTTTLSRRSIVAGVALAPVLARAGITLAADKVIITVVTDTAGLGDQNFNDLADRGGKRAAKELGVTYNVIESQTQADYVRNLTQASEDSQLVIGVGFLLTDAINEVAAEYADVHYLLIDSVADESLKNVTSVTFKENQSSFLTGIIAGLFTKTNKVGFVGGQRIPPVIRYEVGFKAGVACVNPKAEVKIGYADTFDDPGTGKELTLSQYNQGADIVQAAAGRTGIGAFDAAKEKKSGYWVVAADVDQSQLGAEYQLCVAQKGVDTAVFRVAQQQVDGTFEGGVQDLGLKEGGVDLTNVTSAVPADIVQTAADYKAAIIAGKVGVPVDDDSFKAFKPVPPDEVKGMATPAASTPAS